MCDFGADQLTKLPKTWCIPLRHTDALVETVVGPPLPPCLSFSLLSAHYPFFFLSHTLSPNLFPICLSAFLLHRVRLWAFLSNCTSGHFVTFCVIYASFSPHVSPFLRYNQTLSRFPQIPSATPAFSLPLFPSVYLLLFVSLPLCSAHLQHIKIPLFFLQRIVQALRDLLHSSMLSLPLSLHICLPSFLSFLAALHST